MKIIKRLFSNPLNQTGKIGVYKSKYTPKAIVLVINHEPGLKTEMLMINIIDTYSDDLEEGDTLTRYDKDKVAGFNPWSMTTLY